MQEGILRQLKINSKQNIYLFLLPSLFCTQMSDKAGRRETVYYIQTFCNIAQVILVQTFDNTMLSI